MTVRVIQTVIDTCDRCAFTNTNPAEEERLFALDDRFYKLVMCPQHAAMFDRDLNGWTRLAAEVDPPDNRVAGPRASTFFDTDHLADARRARDLKDAAGAKEKERQEAALRQRAAQAKLTEGQARKTIPGSMKWKITLHAYMRMAQRGVSVFQVLETAAAPAQTYYLPWQGEYRAVHQREFCRLVVDEETTTVITVIDRTRAEDDLTEDEDVRAAVGAGLLERRAQ